MRKLGEKCIFFQFVTECMAVQGVKRRRQIPQQYSCDQFVIRIFCPIVFELLQLAQLQVVINCQYSVAQMCTREDTLAHYLGAPYLDDVISQNELTTYH